MNEGISALLVQSQRSSNVALKVALHGAGIQTYHVRSCAEARQVLARPPQPHVIFAQTTPVAKAQRSRASAMILRGAFDFIVPPFMGADLLHIVNCTVWKGLTQERPPTSERAAA